MSVLSDHIETFIKQLLEEDGTTELQRNELANKFNCAPSQINYVLTTRFSPSRGYIIQSRRGGGGYIRVAQLDLDRSDYINELTEAMPGNGINMRQAAEIVEGLYQSGFINKGIKELILSAIADKTLAAAGELRNILRADILREMLFRII